MKAYKSLVSSAMFLAALSIALYIYKPVTFNEISTVEGFVAYARSFGTVMPLAVFIITVIQAIIPVVPFVILCSANGILFGLTNGILITWAATLAGASLTFLVARRMGYEWAAQKYRITSLQKAEQMQGFKGFLVILALRLLPYFPAPLINVTAGVSKISFSWFFLASAIGKLPFIAGYILLGYSLLHTKNYTLGAVIMVLLMVVPYLIVRKTKKKMPSSE